MAILQPRRMTSGMSPIARYRLRLSRKRLLWYAFRKRHALQPVSVRADAIAKAPILLFATMRNEAMRLPHFLSHYRRLGVIHFLIVSNDSTDDTERMLRAQPDVSLWHTETGYKAARFGMDWLTWLQRKLGHGKWVLTVDADELLIYPDWKTRNLAELTRWLDRRGQVSFGAMMLDLYPKGSPDSHSYGPGQDPLEVLGWFDGSGYWAERRGRHQSVTVLGGVRARCFFPDEPGKSPTLSKVPLVRWHRSYAYLSSTHVVLPPGLNCTHDAPGREKPCGILLHTKFLPGVAARAREDKARGHQYTKGPAHHANYDKLAQAPDLWNAESQRYPGWRQLVDLGLMWRGDW